MHSLSPYLKLALTVFTITDTRRPSHATTGLAQPIRNAVRPGLGFVRGLLPAFIFDAQPSVRRASVTISATVLAFSAMAARSILRRRRCAKTVFMMWMDLSGR